jgi:hypothetical protein
VLLRGDGSLRLVRRPRTPDQITANEIGVEEQPGARMAAEKKKAAHAGGPFS